MFELKKLTKHEIKKYFVLTSASVLLILSFILLMAAWSNNAVVIHDGEKTLNLKTRAATVADVLSEAGISLGGFDTVSPKKDELVQNNMKIDIFRAVKISVSDGGVVTEYLSSAQTVAEVLDQAGYTLGEKDTTYPLPDSKPEADGVIEIRRAKNFTVVDENGERNVHSSAYTVADLMAELGVVRSENIHISLDDDVKLKEGMKIKISKVEIKYIDISEPIAYSTENVNTSSLAKGKTRVSREGKNGLRTITYAIKFKDGIEIDRTEVNSVIEKEAVNKIVEIGTATNTPKSTPKPQKTEKPAATKAPQQTTSDNSSAKGFNYSRVLTCSASAYDISYESCGKKPGDPNYGITASGMKAQYGVVAVDPSVIPLGTRLYIEAVDGSWTYGYCVAGDTGSGIRGNRVDLFYNSRGEALSFGRRQAKVYILN